MPKLKPNHRYKVIEVYPESGMYSLRTGIAGAEFTLSHIQRPFSDLPDIPGVFHANIKLESGTMRGMKLFLTYFAAESIHTNDADMMCNCNAYSFPHRKGEGECKCTS